ncbi:HFX_2341 family transcriptional regulator domain-containing protein [Methanosarcina sp. T3]|uniref:HFX_2341 family transcriptional regulator domain-containing protein n=1 Tax=Methanosarcina sp. T3 TaxID=3439062 RepID=UPI003F848D39
MEEIVHIIPLASEIDMAVKPFDKMRANKVYLLHTRPVSKKFGSRSHEYFLQEVKNRLEQKNMEVITVESDLSDPLPLLSTISDIIVQEKKENNLVYVNMSASGKLTAVSSTFAAMHHDVKVYYVYADGGYSKNEEELLEHGSSIVKELKYFILTNFTIDIPTGAKSVFLTELYLKKKMTTNDIINMIKEGKLQGFEDLNESLGGKQRTSSNMLVRINRGLLNELKRNGYILIEKRGRNNIISITDKGKYAACLIGHA